MIFYYPCLKLFSISKLAYLSFEEHKNMSEIVNGADKDIKRKSYTDPNRDFISQFWLGNSFEENSLYSKKINFFLQRFLNPKYFPCFNSKCIRFEKPPGTSLKKHSVSKIVMTFHCYIRMNCSSDLKNFANSRP